MTIRVGDYVSAKPLSVDGRARVRGVVLELRHALVLLELPHGRWCPLATARVVVEVDLGGDLMVAKKKTATKKTATKRIVKSPKAGAPKLAKKSGTKRASKK